MTETFHAIVIGGGSAGCIAAAELAAAPDRRVLLLEAGPAAEEHPETLSADGYKTAFINDQVIWERFTAPQPHAGGQRVFVGSGTVMGGSGSVNGMVYTRGDKRDFDEWPEGWRWKDVAGDFERIEAALKVKPRTPTRWTEACISAAQACGFARKDDLNDGELGNVVGYETMAYDGDRRRSSYVAFIKDAPPKPGLAIRTGAKVHKVVFEGRRATGVHYRVGDRLETAQLETDGHVLLAAGALETPKLLMVSGVGPAQTLRAHGIAEVLDAPAIGQNLHDHPNVPLFYLGRRQVDCLYPQLYSFYRTHEEADLPAGQSDTCYVFWPAPSAMKEVTQRVLPGKVLPGSVYGDRSKQVVRGAVQAAFKIPAVPKIVDRLFGIVVILGKPLSRGSVRLNSADPEDAALVDPNYLAHPQDMATMVRGVAKARALSQAGELADWRARELMPGPWNRSEKAVARWVANNAITTYHFAGTARMGMNGASACDTDLRLRGLENVTIADASAIPTTPVSALNAPSMLVGLRAGRSVGARLRAS